MSNLRQWLNSLTLGQYADAFEAADIGYDVLPELDHDLLKELGVESIGDRLRILKAIRLLDGAGGGDVQSAPEALRAREPSRRSEPAGEAERRQLTVMFCDLVGSTALSGSLDPEDLREVINAYQQSAVGAAERHGGHVARYMGDGILVYFGYPRADEHDSVRAVRAGIAMVNAVSSLKIVGGHRLQTRVGIATGLVVVGDLLESDMAKEHVVVGETPNLAARLQALASPDQVIVADVTRRLTLETFHYEDLGTRPLKGFSESVHVWRAVGERQGAERAAVRLRLGAEQLLVGRGREVELLMNRWQLACENDGQVVLLSGQAGMGKTRIVGALHDALAGVRHLAVRYFCSAHGTGSALHPAAEQLARAARLTEADPPQAKRQKLDALLANPDFGGSQALARDAGPVLGRLLGIDATHAAAAELPTAEQAKEGTLDALVGLMCAMSSVSPVLMVVEDAQWADPTTRELLDVIVERTQDLPVLLLVTCRADFEPAWSEFPHVTSLTLNRLGSREVETMVRALCAGKSLPMQVHERIVTSTDGVPVFIEELTKGVLESGLLNETPGGFELTGPLPPFAIPATLHDSLMARLDRLDSAKDLAQTGAVIGRSFSRAVIETVTDLPPTEVERALHRLEDNGLLMRRGRGPDAVYTFKHALMQEVAYQSLLKSRRQLLHMRIAGVLAERFPEVAAARPEILARQYTEAGLAREAAAAWLDAALMAKNLAAYAEAESHTEALIGVCDALDDELESNTYRARAFALRGDLQSLLGHLQAANHAYEQALQVASDAELRRDIQSRLHLERQTSTNGARICYYVHGSAGHTLLFVNPIVYGLAMFQPVLERLCREFRVVSVDCRGAGRSDPLVRPYSIIQHARDTAAVIDDLGCGPVIGIGVSRGGNQLIRLAAERPELIKALVLVGTPTHANRTSAINEDSIHARPQLDALARGDWDALHEAFARSLYTEPAVRHLARQFVAGCAALPKETMESFFDSDEMLDVSSILPTIDYPVLVTHGTRDERVPFRMATDFHEAIARSRLHAFDGKGHLPVFSAPDEFCDVLRDFVREL